MRDRPNAADLPGFGRYETLLRLGRGGMAEVFAARLRGEGGFDKLVAVKRIRPHLAEDPALVERFFDEARIAAHVSSPHVVQTLDLGRSPDGTPFLVLDLVVGVSLSQLVVMPEARDTLRIAEAPGSSRAAPGTELPLAALVELLAQVAEGLHDVHEARTPEGQPLRIVHRDVSPQNVLVGVDGRARLSDFGVARAVLSRVRTEAGRVLGKLGYLSPEQARGRELDRRSDVFSLGVVAWEALTRRRLFASEREDETYLALLERPVVAPHRIRREVPPELSEVVLSALERDPEARCASARELARGLRRAAAALGAPPDARALAQHVAAAGGEPLRELQQRIAEASGGGPSPEVAPEAGDATEIDTRAPEAADTRPDAPLDARTTRSLGVALTTSSEVTTVPRGSAQGAATARRWWWLAPVALVLLGAGAGLALLLREDPEGPVRLQITVHSGAGESVSSDPPESAGTSAEQVDEPPSAPSADQAGSAGPTERDPATPTPTAASAERDPPRPSAGRSRRRGRGEVLQQDADPPASEARPGALLGLDRYDDTP